MTVVRDPESDWRSEVIEYWFSLSPQDWWRGGTELDEAIAANFRDLWAEKRRLPATSFLGDARTALAAVLLFDQFPRNMFRGHAEQFSTDPLALAIAKGAIDAGLDEQLKPEQRAFLYMPFQHSEDLDDQQRSVLLFSRLGNDTYLDFARKHRDIVERFGRFPHRNAILGRAPRADEVAAGDVVPW